MDAIKKAPWGIIGILFQVLLAAVIYLHTLSVKANIREELKSYPTRDEIELREKSHNEWSALAVKRLEEKIDGLARGQERVERRLEGRPPRPLL